MSAADRAFASAEARLGFGGLLAALGARWVNDPVRTAYAEYKPVQLRVAARSGLTVPRTLVTNNHKAAVRFEAEVGPVVCKTFSSVALSEDGQVRLTYTTPIVVGNVDPDALATTAHLLQEWVPKRFDARVTMVGDQPFAVAIHAGSDAAHVDWRSDYPSLTYSPVRPSNEITAGMIRYLAALGLSFGAFDFVVTPDGQWIMLECNPAGEWLWLQEETAQPIAAAIADHLVEDVSA